MDPFTRRVAHLGFVSGRPLRSGALMVGGF